MKKRFFSVVLCTLSVTAMLTACSLGGGSDEPAFRLKKLPDIGKYETGEIKSYYHGGPVSELIPSDGYGEIVPYISQIKSFKPYKKKSGIPPINITSYGFATADGKIISGGAYAYVRAIKSKDGKTVYAAEKLFRSASELSEIGSDEIKAKTTLIASDGSWKVDVDGVSYNDGGVDEQDEELKNYIITYDSDGMITLYDFSGNEIFNAKQAMPEEKIENVYYAKNGKFIFEITDKDKGSRVVCVNSKGELLTEINIRGYSVLKMINGVFIVCKTQDSEKSNLCDLNGNILLDKDFDLINYDSANRSFICVQYDKRKVKRYDINGALLNEFKAECNGSEIRYFLKGKSGSSIVYKTDEGKYLLYNSMTGEKIKLDLKNLKKDKVGEPSFLPLYTGSDSGGETFILLTRKDGTQEIYDAFGTYIMSVTDFYGPLDRTPDGGYCYKSTDNKFIVRSRSPRNDFEVDLKSDDSANFSVVLYDEKYVVFACSDKNGENEFYKVYDIEKGEIVFDKSDAFESFSAGGKTYYATVKDGISTLLDQNGNELSVLKSDSIF